MDDLQLRTAENREAHRAEALRRLERRRNLQGTVVAYVVINACLIGAWLVTGGGYFWPGWVMAAWGMGLALGLWSYYRGEVTDEDVDQELDRMSDSRR
ncbi:MAG TPA: 2TM domain-containing protein [Acidimicrobiales bacterium]|nr:2TM domain-containing protein [Acidimicrobiales bacterium]